MQACFWISVLINMFMKCLARKKGGGRKFSSDFLIFIFSILKACYPSKHCCIYLKFLPLLGFDSAGARSRWHFSKFSLLRGHLDDIFNSCSWVKSLIWAGISPFCSCTNEYHPKNVAEYNFLTEGNTSQN